MTGTVLWNSEHAAAATNGRNTRPWTASGVSIDSRTLQPGDLFIALRGPNFDGHEFIDKAFAAGAAAAMSHRAPGDPGLAVLDETAPLLLVDDTLAALHRLGVAARARSQARFVGVTGSVGKTSTKQALARCLRVQAPTAASAGSLNNHWGLPLSLARLSADAVYGVFELGMNRPGEIRELTRLLRPEVVLITNIEAAHIGYFASLEEIADAKAEIFEGTEPGGAAILNRDNPYFERLDAQARAAGLDRIIGFGRHPRADARLLDCALDESGSRVEAAIMGRRLEYCVGVPGSHWVINSLAVLATVAAAEADVVRAATELAHMEPVKGRGLRHRVESPGRAFELIDDSYNANPISMRAAFEVLGRTPPGPGGRRIAVLGDMLELGAQSAAMHVDLAAPLREAGIDLVCTCGPEMAALHDALPTGMRGPHATDSHALLPLVGALVGSGDVVLVKGSAGSAMGLVVEALLDLPQVLPRAANSE